MSKEYFPEPYSLFDWFFDIHYNRYLGRHQWVFKLSTEEQYILFLLVWFSEGCPEI